MGFLHVFYIFTSHSAHIKDTCKSVSLTLLHSKQLKLNGDLDVLSAIGLSKQFLQLLPLG